MSDCKPQYTVIAGGNGAGKSTLRNTLLEQGVDLGRILDLDALAKEEGYSNGNNEKVNNDAYLRAAEKMAEEMKMCFDNGLSLTQETTTPSHIRFNKAKKIGFGTALLFSSLDNVEMHIDRVASRVEQDGHAVPEKLIRMNYENSFEGLKRCIPLADQLLVFNNTHSLELVLAAENQIALFKHWAAPQWVERFVVPSLDMSHIKMGDTPNPTRLSELFKNSREERGN